jgi:hypothetical protein
MRMTSSRSFSPRMHSTCSLNSSPGFTTSVFLIMYMSRSETGHGVSVRV